MHRTVYGRAGAVLGKSAETLATVVLTKCSSHESKRMALAAALFRVSRAKVAPVFIQIMQETRKQIITEIVTFRAKATRSAVSA